MELEGLLRSTLVSAERASQDLKESARREADVILTEANAEARKIIRDAITEKERLMGDSGGSRRCCAPRSPSSRSGPAAVDGDAETTRRMRRRRAPDAGAPDDPGWHSRAGVRSRLR